MNNEIKRVISKIEIPPQLGERSKQGVIVNQWKGKFLFVIFAILFVIVSYYLYAQIFDYLIINSNRDVLYTIIFIVTFIGAILPLVIFISGKLSVLLLRISWFSKYFVSIIIILLVALIIVYTVDKIDEYGEKNLGELVSLIDKNVEKIHVHYGNPKPFIIEDVDKVNELNNFLSQYKVEKMKEHEWESYVGGTKGFSFDVLMEKNVVMVSLYEERLNIFGTNNGGYYRVLNGPINVEWIEKFLEGYR